MPYLAALTSAGSLELSHTTRFEAAPSCAWQSTKPMSRTDSSNRDLLWLHRDLVPWESHVIFFYLKSHDIVDLIPGMLVRDLRTKYTQRPPFPSTQSRIAFPGHLFGSRTDLHGVSGVGWPTPRVLEVHDRR